MTKHHEINLKDFQEWIATAYKTYASSSRERKELIAHVGGGYEVRVNSQTVWRGVQPYAAVEAYNDITEPYKQHNP